MQLAWVKHYITLHYRDVYYEQSFKLQDLQPQAFGPNSQYRPAKNQDLLQVYNT